VDCASRSRRKEEKIGVRRFYTVTRLTAFGGNHQRIL
jgi:hypothetical protein